MINQTIAHYKITGKLGQGGMGEVFGRTTSAIWNTTCYECLTVPP